MLDIVIGCDVATDLHHGGIVLDIGIGCGAATDLRHGWTVGICRPGATGMRLASAIDIDIDSELDGVIDIHRRRRSARGDARKRRSMSEVFLYLTTTGRRTGLARTIEIWFVVHEGSYYLVSERRERSNWVQNLMQCPTVHMSIGVGGDNQSVLPKTEAQARVVSSEHEPALVAAVSQRMDDKYGWSDGLVVEVKIATLPESAAG